MCYTGTGLLKGKCTCTLKNCHFCDTETTCNTCEAEYELDKVSK